MSNTIYSTGTDISVLDYAENPSIKKYQYNNLNQQLTYAQPVKDNYDNLAKYSHMITVYWKVESYAWNDGNKSFYSDISDRVVSVSYSCSADSDIRTTASLTLFVPPSDTTWYASRSYESDSIGTPMIYKIEEIIKGQGGADLTRNFGFFMPDDSSYSYDSTTSTFSMQLVNLAYYLTQEGGGIILTGLRTYSYCFAEDYNHSSTKMIAYKECIDHETIESPVYGKQEIEIQYNKESSDSLEEYIDETNQLMKDESHCLEQLSKYKKCFIFGSAHILAKTEFQKLMLEINTPLPITISGRTGDDNDSLNDFKFWSGGDISGLIYSFATCNMPGQLPTYKLPLNGYRTPSYDAEMVSKANIFPNGWRFEGGTSVMTLAKTMLEDKYYEPMVWVDENCELCINTIPVFSNGFRGCIRWRTYGELVISENIVVNEKEFYNVVEVYGKNNEFYGICNGSGGSLGVLNNSSSPSPVSVVPKIKTITNNNLESDQDCLNLAEYEWWKASRNNVSINVQLRDNTIDFLSEVSHVVGEQFIEYKLVQGGKILCLINKASLNDGIWTLELRPFADFGNAYSWTNGDFYQMFFTRVYYNEFIGAKFSDGSSDFDDFVELITNANNLDEDDEPYGDVYGNMYGNPDATYKNVFDELPFSTVNTLAKPAIIAYEFISDNKIRLYISSVDIGFGVVKMWGSDAYNGTINEMNYLGESTNTNGTALYSWSKGHAKTINDILDRQHIYKVFDYQFGLSSDISFMCQLYNPKYNLSEYSDVVTIRINAKSTGTEHGVYLLDENYDILTTENDERITI